MGKWGATAIIHSVIVFWIPYGTYAVWDTLWDGETGYTQGLNTAGLSTFICLVWGMQLTVSFITLSWTKWNVGILVLSQVGFYCFLLLYQALWVAPDFWAVLSMTAQNAAHWLSIVLVLGTMMLWDVSLELMRSQVSPLYTDILREVEAGCGDTSQPVPDFEAVHTPVTSPRAAPRLAAHRQRSHSAPSTPIATPPPSSGVATIPSQHHLRQQQLLQQMHQPHRSGQGAL